MFANSVSNAGLISDASLPRAVDPVQPGGVTVAAWASTAAGTAAPARESAGLQLVAQASAASREISAARVNAQLAVDVYSATSRPPAGWRVASDADLRALNLTARDLTGADGNFQARVYAQGTGDDVTYVIAFRGTRMENSRDWVNNARQGAGLESAYYNNALRIGQQVSRSDERVMMTGHSLGGGLASAAALASGRQADTFNAAGLSNSTIDTARQTARAAGRPQAQIDAYFVRGEVLSAFQDGGDRRAGGVVGSVLLGPLGGVLGRASADAPSAFGTRRELAVVRPEGLAPDARPNSVDLHGMNFVQAALAQAR